MTCADSALASAECSWKVTACDTRYSAARRHLLPALSSVMSQSLAAGTGLSYLA